MDPISLEELAFLDGLERIDQWLEPSANSAPLRGRLVETGLTEVVDGTMRLTDAGIERCKSLHHRVKADAEAALVLMERQKSDESDAAQA